MDYTGKEINELYNQIPRSVYVNNESYYVGHNTKIMEQNRKRSPDNRIPVAFANRLIKNLTGYAGREGDITTKWKTDGSDQSFKTAYEKIEDESMLNLLNSRLYKTVLKHGRAYDIVWTESNNDQLKIRCADIPVVQGLPIWQDELSVVKKLHSFVRYYDIDHKKEEVIQGKTIIFEPGKYAQVFYPGRYQVWFLTPKDERQNSSGDKTKILYEQQQPFDDIQVNTYFGNDEKIPYWWPVKNLIDQFDKVMSGNMNEVDRFNDTWLMFMHKIDSETKRAIDQMGIIDNLKSAVDDLTKDVWPKFLERNIPVDHTKMMFDKLEELIYTIIGVPSFLDETFGTASGVSLLFRLIGLEYAAIETDTYYDIGLHNRNQLIKQGLKGAVMYEGERVTDASIDSYTDVIEHKRNIPMDKTSLIQDAVNLRMAGVSMKAVLEYLPKEIIQDVEEELMEIEKQGPQTPPINLEDDAI